MDSELVLAHSGEVLSLDDPAACLKALHEIRQLEARLREAKAELTTALAAEFSRQGTKTLELAGVKAELKGGSEIVWDTEILEELLTCGLPQERWRDLVSTEVSYKVNAQEAKRIASANERYAEIIERARRSIPKATYVTVKGVT